MFGIFRSRKHPVYPSASSWTVNEGQYGGKPIFVRRNDSASQLAGHADYRFRVGVAVPLNAPDEHGLPGNEEMNQLNAIEDTLAARLEAEQRSLHVLAITTDGMREFVFYTRDPKLAQSALESLRSSITTHQLTSYVAEDRQWVLFHQFA